MSREYPDWLDPWKAADGRRTFSGTMPLSRMPRLQPLLADSKGEARFSAGFAFDGQGMVTISMEVEAQLPLICQRSLELYQQVVERCSLLGVIEDMDEESSLPGNYEPVVVEHRRLALSDLVEDELILALPQVPRKPDIDGDNSLTGFGETSEDLARKENFRQPFAGLADQLKIRNRSNDNGSPKKS
jgi:uncharacterized protein